ncbi:MAG: heme exporter protein CcmD [Brevundimonas sp.]|uniref:heme exporter protein CcmD n=1 Tax=Brevundimonas sp. TaxID=1871086 RepID=UPI00248A6017|nr:heme exporter protein CcmD [Brevundimonas sp.]MDI1325590.1 heme exporter protein CcmD [Brevundimonas sp.]
MIDLDMGAYAAFVWPAWGLSAAVLAALAARALTASRRWNAELKRLDSETGAPARAQAGQSPIAQTK